MYLPLAFMMALTLGLNLVQMFLILSLDMSAQTLLMEALRAFGVGVLLDIDLPLDIRPYQIVQGIEVRGAGLPNVFGPEIEVHPKPALDHVPGVAGGPILHQDRFPGVLEVSLDPGEHVSFQHQLQVLLDPYPEPDWQVHWVLFHSV